MNNFDKKKPTTMFVQPLLDYKSEEWLAMVYGWPEEIKSDSTFVIGFAFKTEKYAREFFDLLRAYNDGKKIDEDDNIKLSIIVEDLKNYSVYIYPSPERKNVTDFLKESEEKFGDDNLTLIANIIMCRLFPYGENSTFKQFKSLYKEGFPIELQAFCFKNGNQLTKIESIEPIVKHDIKIKNRKLLSKDEIEYQHGKKIMGK